MTHLETAIQPPAPAAPAAPPVVIEIPTGRHEGPGELLRAARAHRSELRSQINLLEEKRSELINELRSSKTLSESKPGIVARLKDVDARIIATEKQLALADQSVARAAGLPGATVERPHPSAFVAGATASSDGFIIPILPIVFTIFIVFTVFMAYRIAIGYVRRRGGEPPE